MQVDGDGTGGNCFKQKEGRFRLDIREKFAQSHSQPGLEYIQDGPAGRGLHSQS